MDDQSNYQLNYQNLTFEDKLRVYRMAHIVDYLNTVKSLSILEIGCGNDPIFMYFDDFEKLDIVEPGKLFYEFTKSKMNKDPRITISNNLIEDGALALKKNYDIIIIGGFLHEIDNPEEVLCSVKSIANPDTIVITYVPNADSFHRQLAVESGIIESNYEFSENDKVFGRRTVFNTNTINVMFANCGFLVVKTDTYFIKPFSHEQMDTLLNLSFLSNEILNGLFRLSKFIPNMGCEIFLAAILQ
jgi:SAM-dependent methyltransferase